MQEIRTSGSMSGDGKRSVAAWPKLPRPSSTLPNAKCQRAPLTSDDWGKADLVQVALEECRGIQCFKGNPPASEGANDGPRFADYRLSCTFFGAADLGSMPSSFRRHQSRSPSVAASSVCAFREDDAARRRDRGYGSVTNRYKRDYLGDRYRTSLLGRAFLWP